MTSQGVSDTCNLDICYLDPATPSSWEVSDTPMAQPPQADDIPRVSDTCKLDICYLDACNAILEGV